MIMKVMAGVIAISMSTAAVLALLVRMSAWALLVAAMAAIWLATRMWRKVCGFARHGIGTCGDAAGDAAHACLEAEWKEERN